MFIYKEENLCLLKDFPHENLILPVLNINRLNSDLEISLPCSCPIYWIYQNYSNLKPMLENSLGLIEPKLNIPYHCLNISSILIQEQNDYCQNQVKINQCKGLATTSTKRTSEQTSAVTTAEYDCLPKIDSNAEYCNCSLQINSLNVLECSNLLLNNSLSDYSSNFEWSYVSFLGTSTQSIQAQSFRNIRLADNATLILGNVDFLANDMFSNETLDQTKFRLVIQNSSLNSLGFFYPFRFARLSQLEFIDCLFTDSFALLAFDGVQIDKFLIKRVQAQSLPPFFRFNRLTKTPVIRKLQLVDIRETFSQNSFIGLFVLDGFSLSMYAFSELEELEVRNTRVDEIDAGIFTMMKNLKTVRLENVNLANIITRFYSLLFDENNDQIVLHWVSNETSIERVFLGHEFAAQGFTFENKYLCYFLEQTEATTIFIYDNLDSQSGVECTCTILWIYRYFDFENAAEKYGDDLKYIPNCIKRLKSRSEVNQKLSDCLNESEPLDYCRLFLNPPTTIAPTTTEVTKTSKLKTTQKQKTSSAQTTTLDIPTTAATSNDTVLDYLKRISIGLLILIIMIGVLIVLAIVILVCLCHVRRKNSPRTDKVAVSVNEVNSNLTKSYIVRENNKTDIYELNTF